MTIAGFDGASKFGVEIAPYLAAAGIVGLAFGFGSIPHQRYYFWSFIIENQYRVDIVNLTMQEVPLKRSV
jgi:small conductance mechanosensitive channel